MTPDDYRALLTALDDWFARGRRESDGRVPCRTGCSACCHGPFDVSVTDAELITQAVTRLPPDDQAEVGRRAGHLLDRMRELEPGWADPYEVAALGEARLVIGNACPIQDRFGGSAELDPVAFELEGFEKREAGALRASAARRFGDAGRWTFETTIAAVVAATCSPVPTGETAARSPETCRDSPGPT